MNILLSRKKEPKSFLPYKFMCLFVQYKFPNNAVFTLAVCFTLLCISDKDKEPLNCNRRHPWIRSVLEVGLYGLVRHTGTSSLTGLKPYHHFFLTTVIHRKSFVVTKHVFWAQNIIHAFAYSVHEPPSWLRRSSWRGGMKGERKRRGGE